MKSGTFKFRYNILGYRKGADGEPEIEPEGAETVRLIYDKYLAGESLDQIRASLIENGAKAFNGTVSWNKESIRHILTNERSKKHISITVSAGKQRSITAKCRSI